MVFGITYLLSSWREGGPDLGKRVRRKNRTWMEIAASMLGIAEQGVRKTRLTYLGNLSFELLHKYLERREVL